MSQAEVHRIMEKLGETLLGEDKAMSTLALLELAAFLTMEAGKKSDRTIEEAIEFFTSTAAKTMLMVQMRDAQIDQMCRDESN